MRAETRKKPLNPTGCGNYECQLRGNCKRSDTKKYHHVSMFRPERRHGVVSCGMHL
jgi:hypothetical protein